MTGRSLLPVLQGTTQEVYRADEPIGLEAAGQCVLYKGDMKLVKNGKPDGDGVWRLYNLNKDPGETTDLANSSPTIFEDMMGHYQAYTKQYGVLEMGVDYQPLMEIQNKLVDQLWTAAAPWLVGGLFLIVGLWLGRRFKKRF